MKKFVIFLFCMFINLFSLTMCMEEKSNNNSKYCSCIETAIDKANLCDFFASLANLDKYWFRTNQHTIRTKIHKAISKTVGPNNNDFEKMKFDEQEKLMLDVRKYTLMLRGLQLLEIEFQQEEMQELDRAITSNTRQEQKQ